MRIQKKLLAATIVFAAFITPALATSLEVYPIEELQATIGVPADAYVVSSKTTADDPAFAALGIEDPQAVLDQMKAENFFLDVIASDLSYEISVSMVETAETKEIKDFNLLDHNTILQMAEKDPTESTQPTGIEISGYEIHQAPQVRYSAMELSQAVGDVTTYGRRFGTIYNGQAITVTLIDYSGKALTPEIRALAQDVADSLSFSTPPSDAPQVSTATPVDTTTEDTTSEDTTDYALGYWVAVGALCCFIVGGLAIIIRHLKHKNEP